LITYQVYLEELQSAQEFKGIIDASSSLVKPSLAWAQHVGY